MSITEELRKADIKGQAENVVDSAWELGYAAGRRAGLTEQAMLDRVGGGIDAMTDAELAEHGLVRLPTDADGVPIHVGDVMEWCDSGETLTVEGIGRDVLYYIDGESAEWTAARNKRHHHEPTVEDVLRAMLDALDVDVCDDPDATIAEYAAKLRLAGENA